MCSRWARATALLLILVVAYVLISPVFDLDPSANRAQRVAQLLLFAIATSVLFLNEILRLQLLLLSPLAVLTPPNSDRLHQLCVNLC